MWRSRVWLLLGAALCVCLLSAAAFAEKEMGRGSKGESVAEAQQKLADLGYLEDKADGIFGKKTEAAVKAFQKTLGEKTTGRLSADQLDELNLLWCDVTYPMEGDGLAPEELVELYPSGCARTDDAPGAVDFCWRHFEAGRMTAKLRLPALPDKAVKTLAERACQQWTEGILGLYDEWEQENPTAAEKQREGFETALGERRAEFAETYGEGRAEALRQEAFWLEDICVDLCFDLYVAEGN